MLFCCTGVHRKIRRTGRERSDAQYRITGGDALGDRVSIDGSEGYVEEIGLRMTTLVLEDGNAQVIHNSAVNRFTRKLQCAGSLSTAA